MGIPPSLPPRCLGQAHVLYLVILAGRVLQHHRVLEHIPLIYYIPLKVKVGIASEVPEDVTPVLAELLSGVRCNTESSSNGGH